VASHQPGPCDTSLIPAPAVGLETPASYLAPKAIAERSPVPNMTSRDDPLPLRAEVTNTLEPMTEDPRIIDPSGGPDEPDPEFFGEDDTGWMEVPSWDPPAGAQDEE